MSRPSPATVDPNPLRLAPDPSAARDARAWVTGVLAGWPEESVETARLLVSELVTNSVLHAGTAIAVSYRSDGRRARFEVSDGQQAGPVPKRYAPDSPTGRGMRLVKSLADEWGVERDAGGKTLWFEVSQSTRAEHRIDLASLAAGLAGDLQEIEALASSAPREATPPGADGPEPGAGPARPGPVETVEVHVLGLPLDVYLEAEQHNDAVVRELTLIAQSAGSPGGPGVPRRLLEVANEVRSAFAPASDGLRAQVEEAVRKGQETVDIHMSVPRHGWQALLHLADWLDEVDRYCTQGDLLTLESSPRLRRFRAWYAQQVADQMHGFPATPWQPTP
jgi:anti-sigma regulatory factor (Ser/Thr protein kinase)